MNNSNIRILVTGDFCPVNRVEELALDDDFNTVLNDFSESLEGNDLIITDLECPLTTSGLKREKTGPHQKAHPKCIKILQRAGVGLVAMANNHIMDYGSDGVFETLELCKANKISTVGIGRTRHEAASPFILEKLGKRVAILNFADNEFITSPDGKYCCNALEVIDVSYEIKEAKNSNDFVIAVVHGGNEFYELPSPRTQKLYRYFVEMGADAVIAHHTHAFSGFEVYKTKPIFYGLGNFIYDWPGKHKSDWNRGYVVRLTLSESVDFELIPLNQCNEKPGVAHLNESETEVFESHVHYLNSVISDEKKLEDRFSEYVSSVTPMYDAYIEPYFGDLISKLRSRGLFPKFMSHRKRLLLLNIIRCESHREVVLCMLGKNFHFSKKV